MLQEKRQQVQVRAPELAAHAQEHVCAMVCATAPKKDWSKAG